MSESDGTIQTIAVSSNSIVERCYILLLSLIALMILFRYFYNNDDEHAKNTTSNIIYHQQQFYIALTTIELVSIGLLIIVSIVYHVIYYDDTTSNTYLSQFPYYLQLIMAALVNGGLHVLSMVVLFYSRGFPISQVVQPLTMSFFIMSALTFLFESSGLNRFLYQNSLEQADRSCVYTKLDGTDQMTPEQLNEFRKIEQGGSPFLNSIAYASILILLIVFLYFIITMISTTYYGSYVTDHQLDSIKTILFGQYLGVYGSFIVELILTGGIGLLSFYLPNFIQGWSTDEWSTILSWAYVAVCVSITIMCQYNGLLIPSKEYCVRAE